MQNIDRKKVPKTLCEKCVFSRPTKEKNNCSIGIIESIKDDFQISTINKYNVIDNYLCAYALSRETYDIYSEEFGSLDNAKIQSAKLAQIKYSLTIYTEEKHDTKYIKKQLEKLNQISIEPKHIQIIGKDKEIESIQQSLSNILKPGISWKCNGYIAYDAEYSMIKWALSTNNNIKQLPYVWLLHIDMIDEMMDNNIIDFLHNIVVIKQVNASALIMKNGVNKYSDISNKLFGLFTTSDFWFFSSHYIDEINFKNILNNVQKEYTGTEYVEYAY